MAKELLALLLCFPEAWAAESRSGHLKWKSEGSLKRLIVCLLRYSGCPTWGACPHTPEEVGNASESICPPLMPSSCYNPCGSVREQRCLYAFPLPLPQKLLRFCVLEPGML